MALWGCWKLSDQMAMSGGVWWSWAWISRCAGFGGAAARAGLGAFVGALSGFLESMVSAVELDDFAAMDEAVDEGDDTGGGGEHVGPFGRP